MLSGPALADPYLGLLAESLDDIEKTRIAAENRLRQLTRTEPDDDGEMRGFGLPEDASEVMAYRVIVSGTQDLEKAAVRSLERQFASHALCPWVKAQKGLGAKQTARLLAAIRDPYWNTLHDRPRTVSELWAFCGLSVIDGEAQARRKGVQSNWSQDAKMRVYLVIKSCVKQRDNACKTLQETEAGAHYADCSCSPYRIVYDAEKLAASVTGHSRDCRRCGPSGKPALAGSALSPGHQDSRALRHAAKELLKDLYNEAKRLHQAV